MDELKKQLKTRKQHYVPRMYIKRFGYGSDEKPRISILFKKENRVQHNKNPEYYAVSHFFYDTTESALEEALKEDLKVFPDLRINEKFQDEQFVEHALAREEREYKIMLDEIEANPRVIYNDKTRAIFISFVHGLAYRTKRFRDIFDDINDKTEIMLKKVCDNLGMDEQTKENTIKANCISGQQLQIEKIVSLAPVLETMNRLLLNYNWYIAYNNTDLDFIISDNPAQAVWIGMNEICIPVSKKIGIVLRVKLEDAPMFSKDAPEGDVIDLSLQSVIAYNLIQIGMSQRYLFGSEKAIDFMSMLNDVMNTMKGNGRKILTK